MINNSSFGKPRVPMPKVDDVHREVVENKVRQMVAATDGSANSSEHAVINEPKETDGKPKKKTGKQDASNPSRTRSPRHEKSSDQQRILVEVPVTPENLKALSKLVSAQPTAQQPVIQRRLISKARDLMVSDKGKTVWKHNSSEAMSCRIRLDPSIASEIYLRLEPLGLRSQVTVLGHAMAAHLNGILDQLPR